MRAMLFATACLVWASSVQAEPAVTSGLWSYKARATLGFMPVVDAGNYCLDETQAAASYERLLNDINPNCVVTDGTYAGDAYRFTLSCNGGPDGELDGTLSVKDDAAELRASGWTTSQATRLPVLIRATAEKRGSTCP